jgi:uncharacterized C2H2 Zn-finger protein
MPHPGGGSLPRVIRLKHFLVRERQGIQVLECLQCGRISSNSHDIAQRYCGKCHEFLEEDVVWRGDMSQEEAQ